MIGLQMLNKLLETKDGKIILDAELTPEYFPGYEDEFNFIHQHFYTYGNIPDKETFLAAFQDFEILQVSEGKDYLVDKIREERLYSKAVGVVQDVADILKRDSNEAVEYLMSSLPTLQPSYSIGAVDIAAEAMRRLERVADPNSLELQCISTGFPELDNIFRWLRGEEFGVIVARTGQGKSWVLGKMIGHAWKLGFNVGMISPEISPDLFGYRMDTLMGNFSNTGLMNADYAKFSMEEYTKYIHDLSQKKGFYVSTPTDFSREITVPKLRNYIKQHDLQMLAIDGISYLKDYRSEMRDNKTIALTHISEDIIALSLELGLPILAVVQSNRAAASEDGPPDIEHIRDSDGIAYNATRILSLKQDGQQLQMALKKNRYGPSGMYLNYEWRPDLGQFTYKPSKKERIRQEKQQTKEADKIPSTSGFKAGRKDVQF